jgi:hypothetical protein
MSSFFYHANIETDGDLILGETTITTAEIAVLDGVTAGTAASSKALVLDGSGNVTGLGEVSCGSINASTLLIGGNEVSASAEQLNYLAGVTAGSADSNKALVLDSSGNILGLGTIGCGAITSTGNLDVTGTITTSETPTNDDHVATKKYVDDVASGLDVKESVRAATTANGDLESAFANGQTVDGVTLATDDRILIKNQTTASENGIYIVKASGTPDRATDFPEPVSGITVTAGAFTFVEEGGQADTGWVLTTNGTITVGSSNLAFSQFSSSSTITGGTGLTKTGNTLSVDAAQTQITSVGTIATGTWNGTAIAVANGGTGATSLTDLITLGDHTTGNYVASLTAGSLIDLQNNSGEGATPTIDVDLSEAAEAAIANGDYILFLDGGASGTPAKENIADVATLFAGTGLTALNSVISVDAAQTVITSILATDLKIGEDDQTKIDFETADEIHFYAANAEQVYVADGIFGPQTDDDVDLGSNTVRWKDAYFDGTVTSDAFAGPLTGDVTGNADTATVATTVTITDNESTNEDNAIIFTAGGDVDGGNLGLESDGTLTYNPSTGKITATGFIGTLTGNVTGNCSGTAATVTTAAQSNITSLGTLTSLTVGGQLTLGVQNINTNIITNNSTALPAITKSSILLTHSGAAASTQTYTVSAGTDGQVVHIFFSTEGPTQKIKLDFGPNSLYSGSGTARYLEFSISGQSATVIYTAAITQNSVTHAAGWRIINTGAAVS